MAEKQEKSLPWERMAVDDDYSEEVYRDISQADLLVLAPVIGRACVGPNKAFLRCRQYDENPAVCVTEGADVHRCVNRIYDDFKDQETFQKYSTCLVDKTFFFDQCQNEKEAFHEFVQKTKYKE